MKTRKFYLTKEEWELIASTPESECWICDLFSNNVIKDEKGLFISEEIVSDDGLKEHLHQLIRREVNFISS